MATRTLTSVIAQLTASTGMLVCADGLLDDLQDDNFRSEIDLDQLGAMADELHDDCLMLMIELTAAYLPADAS